MAAKKKTKRKPSKKQRSAAAKKGWETRRRNEALKRLDKSDPQLTGIEDEYQKELRSLGLSEEAKAELSKQEPEILSRMAKVLVEQFIREGKIDDSPEERIKARLRIAHDDSRYYDEVLELGDEYPEYSLHEIYTMGVSP